MVSLMPWFRQAQAKISFSVWLVSQTWAKMVLHLILVLFVIILHLICLKDHLLSYRCTMQKLMKRNTQRLEDRYLLMDKNILYNSYWLLQSFWSYDLQTIIRILSKQITCSLYSRSSIKISFLCSWGTFLLWEVMFDQTNLKLWKSWIQLFTEGKMKT